MNIKTLRAIRNEIEAHAVTAAKTLDPNLSAKVTKSTYDSTSASITLTFTDNNAIDADEATFKALAPQYGLNPSDYGKVVTLGRTQFRLTAIRPNRPKMPIEAVNVKTGTAYKLTADQAQGEHP